uniref:NXPE family member 3-like n=1 Tax=Maylandia zebra TaxID=106582 RepID=UPI000D310932|nr:NXPE family member 3-like [Maylandia zebra]
MDPSSGVPVLMGMLETYGLYSGTSHPAHSAFTILPRWGGGQWHIGDKLEVMIQMHDFQGHLKRSGGDVLLARLHNITLGAGVAGQVLDHLNGSYSAIFTLLWEGNAQVQVILVHPSEAVTELRRLNTEHPDRVFFKSQFQLGSVTETTTCNVCLRPTQQPVCNYTDLHTNEPWFCYKPKSLSCDTRISNFKGGYKQKISTMEKLFQSGVNLKVAIPPSGVARVNVLPKQNDLKAFNMHSQKTIGPLMSLDYKNNILVTYRTHGPPLRSVSVPAIELHYIANELDEVPGGRDTVIVLGIWAHFGTFPIEFFIRRLQTIRRAMVRLLSRAPDTLIVIRTGNPKSLKTFLHASTNSDWYSLQQDKVLRDMFKELNVHLVDAWEMVVAHHLPHELHPQPSIIKNMINVLLSYICPQKGG